MAALRNNGHLHRTGAFCLAPSPNDASKLEFDPMAGSVDYEKTSRPEEYGCQHTLQETWESWANFFGVPIFGEAEIIEVNFKDHHVTSIGWHGGGNNIG